MLKLVQKEMKQKAKMIKLQNNNVAKKTMRCYFKSSRGLGGRQVLAFDGHLLEMLGVVPNSTEDYSIVEFNG